MIIADGDGSLEYHSPFDEPADRIQDVLWATDEPKSNYLGKRCFPSGVLGRLSVKDADFRRGDIDEMVEAIPDKGDEAKKA